MQSNIKPILRRSAGLCGVSVLALLTTGCVSGEVGPSIVVPRVVVPKVETRQVALPRLRSPLYWPNAEQRQNVDPRIVEQRRLAAQRAQLAAQRRLEIQRQTQGIAVPQGSVGLSAPTVTVPGVIQAAPRPQTVTAPQVIQTIQAPSVVQGNALPPVQTTPLAPVQGGVQTVTVAPASSTPTFGGLTTPAATTPAQQPTFGSYVVAPPVKAPESAAPTSDDTLMATTLAIGEEEGGMVPLSAPVLDGYEPFEGNYPSIADVGGPIPVEPNGGIGDGAGPIPTTPSNSGGLYVPEGGGVATTLAIGEEG